MEAVIHCPNSGELVPIGIETEETEWDRPCDHGVTLCVVCGEQHWWSGEEVMLRPVTRPPVH